MTADQSNRSYFLRPHRLRAALGLALATAFLLVGCGGAPQAQAPQSTPPSPPSSTAPNPSTTPNPSPTPNPSTTVPSGLHQADFRTGQPKVDAVIDAFMKKDVDRLTGMVALAQGKCAKGSEFWCGAGEADGTVKQYFSRSTCTTSLVPPDQVRVEMESWVKETRYLYAAYSVHGIGDRAYEVIFANGLDDHTPKIATLNADGKIVDLGHGCNVPTTPLSTDHYTAIAAPVAR